MTSLFMRARYIACFASAAVLPLAAQAQTESIFFSIGTDTPSPAFAHLSAPGATGIDFDLFGAFASADPDGLSREVFIWFEWATTPTGPWTTSPPNIKTIPAGITTLFDTHVYHGPEDAPFVRLHFAAGALMTVSGTFSHVSVVPELPPAMMLAIGLAALLARRRALQGTTR